MATRTDTLIAAAKALLDRRFQPVPVPAGEKGPRTLGWRHSHLDHDSVAEAFRRAGNLGVMCGEPSGWLIDVDLDCIEAVRLAPEFLPATEAKTGRAGSRDSHWWYRAAGTSTQKFTDRVSGKMVVELRSTGQQTLVGPSIHPETGETYQPLTGDPAAVDPERLRSCVERLYLAVMVDRHGEAAAEPKPKPTVTKTRIAVTPSPQQLLNRAGAYLDKMPAALSGQGGHNATYAAATALVHGFCVDPADALRLLIERYNPRCEPSWSIKELEHKVHDAATKPHTLPRGWLHAS